MNQRPTKQIILSGLEGFVPGPLQRVTDVLNQGGKTSVLYVEASGPCDSCSSLAEHFGEAVESVECSREECCNYNPNLRPTIEERPDPGEVSIDLGSSVERLAKLLTAVRELGRVTARPSLALLPSDLCEALRSLNLARLDYDTMGGAVPLEEIPDV